MRVFVTGASGWIGSAVVAELLGAGHQVVGLARSDAGADIVSGLGADVLRGDLDDLDSLRAGAGASEGVVHMAYVHDFTQMAAAAQTDLAAIQAMGDVLEGSGSPLVIASGVVGLVSGRVATEEDDADPSAHPRIAGANAALALADRGVRPIVLRLPPTVHGPGDHGFIATLSSIAREHGASGYVGDGSNRWPAVHRLDAAHLARLAVEQAPAGSILHATAEEGIAARDIAESIGRGLGIPVDSVPAEAAAERFGWLARFFSADVPASSTLTRQRLAWTPTHPGLLADIDAGFYTSA
jgi:nucleoside-diphosphate-sugar epimerase